MSSLSSVHVRLPHFFRFHSNKANVACGVSTNGEQIELFFQSQKDKNVLEIVQGKSFSDFQPGIRSIVLPKSHGEVEVLNVRQFSKRNSVHLLYTKKTKEGTSLYTSHRIKNQFLNETKVQGVHEKASIVSDFSHNEKWVMYFGQRSIKVAYSHDLEQWEIREKPVLLDASPLMVGDTFITEHGILVLYFKKQIYKNIPQYSAYLALFSRNHPDELIWKTDLPIWEQDESLSTENVSIIGTVLYNDVLITYLNVSNTFIYAVLHSGFVYHPAITPTKHLKLKKHVGNPIIAPKPNHSWEAFTTFNPSAIYLDNKVHILYRAQGYDYISSVGYACSHDGFSISERSNIPIYAPQADFEMNNLGGVNAEFVSGGGYGGCEDPRLTCIGNTVYMTYVAFDGYSPPRLALTSILLENFLAQRWLWSKPVLISRPGEADKSGCLLPEKINGKYVFFHRVFPNILVDFVDDLNFDGKQKWLRGQYKIPIRPHMWDSRKIGAGAPPLKTKDGWLLIYYGVDDKDDSQYKIGAMLLDLQDPTKVLYRSNYPILEPSEEYENTGFKPGVAYPCGAVIIDNVLLVYYGGADNVVCVASSKLDEFISELKSQEKAKLNPIHIQEIQA